MAVSLAWSGFLERCKGQLKTGWGHGKKAVEIALEANDPWITVQSLYYTYTRPKPNKMHDIDGVLVRSMFENGLNRLCDAKDLWGIAIGKHALGDMLTVHLGALDEACANYKESLSLFRKLNDKWMTANTLRCMGIAEFQRNNNEGAEECLRGGIKFFDEIGSYTMLPYILVTLARLALRRNDCRRAARFFGAAVAILKFPLGNEEPAKTLDFDPFKEIDINSEQIAAQWSQGLKMSLRQVIAFALGN